MAIGQQATQFQEVRQFLNACVSEYCEKYHKILLKPLVISYHGPLYYLLLAM